MNFIDLTLPIENGMPTCGTAWHQKVKIETMATIDELGRKTSSYLLGSHTGTHMDAPCHFIQGGGSIDEISVERMCGDITIVDFRRFGRGKEIQLCDVEELDVTERMLFVFGWYQYWKTEQYYVDFPYFSKEAISHLVQKGMRFIAMDTPSPDPVKDIHTKDDSYNHKLLLRKQVVIVEYLTNTEKIDFNKKYHIIALPLKVAGGDGASCRVILCERDEVGML